MGRTFNIYDLIQEEINLQDFKARVDLSLTDSMLPIVKEAYEPAIQVMNLRSWNKFSEENKTQLIQLKFLSLEERLAEERNARIEQEKRMENLEAMLKVVMQENQQLRALLPK